MPRAFCVVKWLAMSDISFEDYFGCAPQAVASAHGRVNLIGEHTDYCGGLVMPTLINQKLVVQIALTDTDEIHGKSSEFGTMRAPALHVPSGSWLCFVKGAISLMNEKGAAIKGLNILTLSTIPAGGGVSSSAAFEIALLRALSDICAIALDPKEMAMMGQRIEHEFIGTKCGIMDQMAVAGASFKQALSLDCASLETQIIPIPKDMAFAVIHSGSSRKLSDSLYNERLAETKKACAQMGYEQLSQAKLADLKMLSDEILMKRSHHVISENRRVIAARQALINNDELTLGALMRESHLSLRDDYEVSSEVLDNLVSLTIAQGAYGARLTGAGFGGCIVALLHVDSAYEIIQNVLVQAPNAWLVDCL